MSIHNPVTHSLIDHPLQNPVTIFQLYDTIHCTTLKADNNLYHHYDGLHLPSSEQSHHICNKLREWYSSSVPSYTPPPALHPTIPEILHLETPSQKNEWSDAMHMLLVSLAAVYQSTIPSTPFNQRHAHQLSRLHLRYIITRELTSWATQLLTFLTDPTHIRIPISHNTHTLQAAHPSRTRPPQPGYNHRTDTAHLSPNKHATTQTQTTQNK